MNLKNFQDSEGIDVGRTDANELFQRAYSLHYGDGQITEIIEICRQALVKDPLHFQSLVMLGILLDQHGRAAGIRSEVDEGRKYLMQSILSVDDPSVFIGSSEDSAPILNLAVWEQGEGNLFKAAIFFLIEYLTGGNLLSYGLFLSVLSGLDAPFAEEVRIILDRIAGFRDDQSVKINSSV